MLREQEQPASTKLGMAAAAISRELPMPNVTRITTLSQAHATLMHCWNKLTRFAQMCASGSPGSSRARDDMVSEERKQFQSWLDRWEQAFTDFLSSAMPSMASDELTQCRVLKANHLSCTIMSAEAGPNPADYDAFEPEFQAIVELSSVVLSARQRRDSPTSATSSPIASLATVGLDVQNPLHLVVTYCGKAEIRGRANEILLRLFRQ
jgi:hypothetical protein